MKNREKNRRFLFLTSNIGFKTVWILVFAFIIVASGCEKFYEPDLGIGITEDDYFNDESEFRAAVLGLYSLQQDLVEQLVILGELRGDLTTITDYADNDLREIYYFNVSPNNKYASPRGFYRLINACNMLLNKLEEKHPNVKDPKALVNNYDRYYGEVLCMRAWAYFNAARIYGKIPYIPSSITGIKEIEKFVSNNAFSDLFSIIDTLTLQLRTKVKAVGVNHYIVNGDATWDATIWTNYSRLALLGQMYLTKGDLVRARESFQPIMFNNDQGYGIRFGLDNTFAFNSWKNILTTINLNEHIYVLRFNKSDRQRHELQNLFSNLLPNSYQIKPSRQAVLYWETIWSGFKLKTNEATGSAILDPFFPGKPGDFYRGINVSYGYFKGGMELTSSLVDSMLNYKRRESYIDVNNIMDGVDTVITKYSLNKNPFDWDANFILYRAAGVHLYHAEILTALYLIADAQNILNREYRGDVKNLGVRGRVGFANRLNPPYNTNWADDSHIEARISPVYLRDPFTNQVIGSMNLPGPVNVQNYLEDMIIEEKARELAYEGERFYDLMRVAQRRMEIDYDNGKRFLADKVAARYSDAEKAMMHERLMDEKNWYLPFYIGTEAIE